MLPKAERLNITPPKVIYKSNKYKVNYDNFVEFFLHFSEICGLKNIFN